MGRVTRAHGIRGEVAVLNLSEVKGRFDPGSRLRLEDNRALTVEAARPHGHRLLVKFEEVPDRTVAEAPAQAAEPAEESEGSPEEAAPSETPEASSEEVVAQATEGSRASDEDDAEGDTPEPRATS